MPLPDSAFLTSFRTPSPDSDDDGGASGPGPGLSAEAFHMQELTLSGRDDRAVFKETPFTMAAQRGTAVTASGVTTAAQQPRPGRKSIQPVVDGSQAADKNPAPIRQPAKQAYKYGTWQPSPEVSTIRPKSYHVSAATAKNGTGTSITARPASTAPSEKPRIKWSGWTDGIGRPIPVDAPKPKSILDIQAEKEAKDARKRAGIEKRKATLARKKAAKKAQEREKAKAESDAIKFGRLPANTGPTDDFPIVQALQRQKALPVKADKDFRRQRDIQEAVQSEAVPNFGGTAQSDRADHSPPRTPSDDEFTVCESGPSTITHVPSSIVRKLERIADTSSSALPYSSPTEHQANQGRLVMQHPRPVKNRQREANEVKALEHSVTRSEASSSVLTHNRFENVHPSGISSPITAQSIPSRIRAERAFAKARKRSEASSPISEQTHCWTTLPPLKRRKSKSSQKSTPVHHQKALPKHFVRPISLSRPPVPPPELVDAERDVEVAARPYRRLTLFQPRPAGQSQKDAANTYTVKTLKGTQYGAAVDGKRRTHEQHKSARDLAQIRRVESSFKGTPDVLLARPDQSDSTASPALDDRSWRGEVRYEVDFGDRKHDQKVAALQYRPIFAHQSVQNHGEEDDWTKAWGKRPTREQRLVDGPASGPLQSGPGLSCASGEWY
ncbi:hypothetical protein IAU60_000718 [Kwoniella sp. DSM 27419]